MNISRLLTLALVPTRGWGADYGGGSPSLGQEVGISPLFTVKQEMAVLDLTPFNYSSLHFAKIIYGFVFLFFYCAPPLQYISVYYLLKQKATLKAMKMHSALEIKCNLPGV